MCKVIVTRRYQTAPKPTYCNIKLQQAHHHNGDQAARRPRMTCSIFGRRFTTPPFAFEVRGIVRGWAHSIARQLVPISSPLTHMVYF